MTSTAKSPRFWLAVSLSALLLFGAMPLPTFAKADTGKGATVLTRSAAKKSGKKPTKPTKPGTGRAKKGVHPPNRKK